MPAILTMQIWDNDLFNPDDFIGECFCTTCSLARLCHVLHRFFLSFFLLLGTLDFNLNAMPEPVNSASACTLDQIENPTKVSDIFKRKRMKGWWPAYEVDDEGTKLLNVSNGFERFSGRCTSILML